MYRQLYTVMANYGTTTLSTSQVNKGANQIIAKTSALTQVLKQFSGIGADALKDVDGLTVDAWMAAMGVVRPTNKAGGAKPYDLKCIRAAWEQDMKTTEGALCVFKNVRAKVKIDDEVFAVYTREEAEKLDGKPLSVYRLAEVGANKWTVTTMLKGLQQSRDFTTHNDRAARSELDFANLDDLCIVRINNNQREIVAVNKSEVYF